MTTDSVIESYVNDVVGRLPRRQRNDIAFELLSLLKEELQGRAADSGREADTAMVLELLSSFGRPVDVADRYRPAGFTIIRPADAPGFAWIALGGVVVQWVVTLVATFSAPVDPALPGSDWLSRLGSWWLSWGLGSFWWPGFIISITVIAAAIRAARPRSEEWTPPRGSTVDREQVHRPVMVLYIALGVVGATIVTALPMLASWGRGLPQPVLDAFVFDPDFLAWRAPWVLLLWAATLAIGIALLVTGRWTPMTRRLALILDVACIALLVWWVLAGPVFTSAPADEATKAGLILVVALTVFDAVMAVRRISKPVPSPMGRV